LSRSEATPALSGASVRSASPGPAGFELDSGDLLMMIAEFESLFELKRHSFWIRYALRTFHRHHITILQNGLRSTLAKSFIFRKIVYQTKDANQKRDKIHSRDRRKSVCLAASLLRRCLFHVKSPQNPHIGLVTNILSYQHIYTDTDQSFH